MQFQILLQATNDVAPRAFTLLHVSRTRCSASVSEALSAFTRVHSPSKLAFMRHGHSLQFRGDSKQARVLMPLMIINLDVSTGGVGRLCNQPFYACGNDAADYQSILARIEATLVGTQGERGPAEGMSRWVRLAKTRHSILPSC